MVWIALIGFGLAVAIALYNFFEGESLLSDLWDEWRLSRSDISALDEACRRNTKRAKVIISLTTIPSRMDYLGDTLKSLLRQTIAPEEIRLNIPRYSNRENREYRIPDWIRSLKSVQVVPCEDWGPATKLIPALEVADPDQKILVIDDDRIYPANLIELLDGAATVAPDTAYGFGGWIVPADFVDRPTTVLSNLMQRAPAPVRATRLGQPRAVDILQGMAGYIVRRRFFDMARLKDYASAPPAAFLVDDVWISGNCNAAKYVLPVRRNNFPRKLYMRLHKRTSLGWLNRGGNDNEKRNNTIMLKYFGNTWRVGGQRA